MPAFANPCAGTIYAKGAAHPAGTFAVTATFADHLAGNRAPGIDIGDGRCGDPVLAPCSGVISLLRLGTVGATTGDKASIFRIKRSDGWEVGPAHLKIGAGFAVGQSIVEGQQIGTVDKIGATACHIHVGCKDPNGVEVDIWPLLRQNGATEEDVLQGANPVRIVNRQSSVLGNDTNFRSSPFVKADNKLVKFDAGAQFYPDWQVEGTQVGPSNIWFGGWANVGAGKEFGYFHGSVIAPLSPIEQSGHTDAELIEAAKRAGYNASADVAAMAAATAAKYPKP